MTYKDAVQKDNRTPFFSEQWMCLFSNYGGFLRSGNFYVRTVRT